MENAEFLLEGRTSTRTQNGHHLSTFKLDIKRGVNRGMEICRSVPFFGPNPSIRLYFCSNPEAHYIKSYYGMRLLQ